jgi:hypothetical protein
MVVAHHRPRLISQPVYYFAVAADTTTKAQMAGKSVFNTKVNFSRKRASSSLADRMCFIYCAHCNEDECFHEARLAQASALVLFHSRQRPAADPNPDNYPFNVVAAPLGTATG